MLSDAIRKRLQPKEASLSERDAMLSAHYESSLVTSTAQPGRRNSLEARARLPQHASRTPPESSCVEITRLISSCRYVSTRAETTKKA